MKKLIAATMLLVASLVHMQAVTLTVRVPAATQRCYVVGSFNGWSPSTAPAMTRVDSTTFTYTDDTLTLTQLAEGYKYLCGPDWAYVEKDANGGEISNRTAPANPDVVGSWAALYEVNESLDELTMVLNGYKRNVQILRPEGYNAGSESYPVIYYVGVNQRYSNSGDDGNPGDAFFSAKSWAAAQTLADAGAIVVASYSFVAENIPYASTEFMGSGQADAYLDDFVGVLKAYVDGHYRTLPDAAHTAIMGGDLGGMLATYAALTRDDVFGRALAFSPMLWANESEMSALAAGYEGGARVALAYGTAEPSSMESMVTSIAQAMPSATVTTITNGTHCDLAWGEALPAFKGYLVGNAAAPAAAKVSAVRAAQVSPKADTLGDYTMYSLIKSQKSTPANTELAVDNVTFTHVDNFRNGGADTEAVVAVRVIPTSIKTYFYWNLKRAGSDAFVISSPRNVSFSSKKSSDSWLRVAVLPGETVKDIAASSTGFRVKSADGTTMMTAKSGYTVTANVAFTTSDKAFTIRYGSVNSNSDMGDITETYTASDRCTAATIDYDFATNRVTITETSWGDILTDDYVIECFTAVPSVTHVGGVSAVTIRVAGDDTYGAGLTASVNYGTPYAISLTPAGRNAWTAEVPVNIQGICTLTLSLTRGSSVKEQASTINIRVGDKVQNDGKQVSIVANAYAGIDWTTTGRYKANFHTHTSQSFDTSFSVSEVVDRYHNAGYKILALTDHDANPYPWNFFDLYNPSASARDAEALGMLAIPGNELSKDARNNWSESTGGEFNHHNDFFTGRKGQEFMSLQESYAYTQALGGMQIINHPGQYWSLDKEYTDGEKNSPGWHANNFLTYSSLVGLEVYNQGNRRPNDRILWDQILDRTMPGRPVWGYSCDDTHTAEQYFRNYQYMLMPELSVDALKACMANGSTVFSYEYTGSGNALAPVIESIVVDETTHTITVNTDSDNIKWIVGTDRSGGQSTRKSTVVARGKTFDYTGFEGKYVRAIMYNSKGETCTQPFGFAVKTLSSVGPEIEVSTRLTVFPNPVDTELNVVANVEIESIDIYTLAGVAVMHAEVDDTNVALNVAHLAPGVYVLRAATADGVATAKVVKR